MISFEILLFDCGTEIHIDNAWILYVSFIVFCFQISFTVLYHSAACQNSLSVAFCSLYCNKLSETLVVIIKNHSVSSYLKFGITEVISLSK